MVKRRLANPTKPRTTPYGAGIHDKFVRQSRELINYSNFVNYQSIDRWTRYSDFSEMESRGEIAATLQIYADEVCSLNSRGEILKIRSSNANIRAILETLFLDTLELDFYLPAWVRLLCKYGDFALFHDIDPSYGIINVVPIPIAEFQRVEGMNPHNPLDVVYLVGKQDMSNRGFAAQYSHVHNNMQAELSNMGYSNSNMDNIFSAWGETNEAGNQFTDWQISHFRLLGNDMFMPYGTSILDPARRLWRLLYMTEDLMLMYRAYRSSERLAFYIDTRGLPKEQETAYMEDFINHFKREPAVVPDKDGGYDYIFNPFTMSDDFFLPVQGSDSGTKIETVAAGSNTAHTEDVEYLHKQLFAALNVPPAYLGYGEGAESFMPQNLSQIHIRFARTIERIQRVVLQQLYKMAYIQLTCAGFSDEELVNFTLELASPSNAAQQSYLQNLDMRANAASTILGVEGLAGRSWVRKNIMGWDEQECEEAVESRFEDIEEDKEVSMAEALSEAEIEKAVEDFVSENEPDPEGGPGGGGFDDFGGDFGGDDFGGGLDDDFGGGLDDDFGDDFGDDDFAFDSAYSGRGSKDGSKRGKRAGGFLGEIVDPDNSLTPDQRQEQEEEAYQLLRYSDDLSPYPRVSDEAKYGSIGVRGLDGLGAYGASDDTLKDMLEREFGDGYDQDVSGDIVSQDITIRPITPVPSPSSEAGWELTDEEDIIDDIDNLIDAGWASPTPIKPSGVSSKGSHERSQATRGNAIRPLVPKKDPASGMAAKRDRDGIKRERELSPQEVAQRYLEKEYPGEAHRRERKPGEPPWKAEHERKIRQHKDWDGEGQH